MYFSIIASLLLVQLSAAQFDFFGNMFAQQQQQQQQRQQNSGVSQWETHSASVSCAEYLCPGTLTCVARPSECPCPSPEDIKCIIPDGEDADDATVICTRGQQECTAVMKLMRKV